MSEFFDEDEADQNVISNLIKEIRRLTNMPFFQLSDGTIIHAENVEVVTVEELQSKINATKERVSELEALLPVADSAPVPPEAAPAIDAPAPEAPVAPEAPASGVPAPDVVPTTPPDAPIVLS